MIDLTVSMSTLPFAPSFSLTVEIDPFTRAVLYCKHCDYVRGDMPPDDHDEGIFVGWKYPDDQEASLEWFRNNLEWLRQQARQRMLAPLFFN